MQHSQASKTQLGNNKAHRILFAISLLMLLLSFASFLYGNNGFAIFQMIGLIFLSGFLVDHLMILAALFGNLYAIAMLISSLFLLCRTVKKKALAHWLAVAMPLVNLMLFLAYQLMLTLALTSVGSHSASDAASRTAQVLSYALNPQTIGICLFLILCVFWIPKLNQNRA